MQWFVIHAHAYIPNPTDQLLLNVQNWKTKGLTSFERYIKKRTLEWTASGTFEFCGCGKIGENPNKHSTVAAENCHPQRSCRHKAFSLQYWETCFEMFIHKHAMNAWPTTGHACTSNQCNVEMQNTGIASVEQTQIDDMHWAPAHQTLWEPVQGNQGT